MYAIIFTNVFDPDGLDFLLFISLSVAVMVLLALPFFNIVPFRQAQESPGRLPSPPLTQLARRAVAGWSTKSVHACMLALMHPHPSVP